MSGTTAAPEGITNPPIDALLDRVDSKYSLVIFGAKRARQINAYYSQLGEGLLEYVGPLVETHVPTRSRCPSPLREISEDLLTPERTDARGRDAARRPGLSMSDRRRDARPAGRPRRGRWHRRLQGRDLLRRLTESATTSASSRRRSALQFVGAPTWAALSGHPVSTDVFEDVHDVPHVRDRPAGRPRRSSRRPPPNLIARPPTAWPTTC